MLYAAKEETAPVFFLAASFASFPPSSVAENSHPGHRLPTAVLHRGFAPVISNTATGFGGCLYDFGRRSRSTGKERDAETGLDYFGARYFSGAQGRFTSPDWSADPDPVPYADFQNPQSLNLYSYVLNNPLKSTDPDGHTHQECAPDTSSVDKNGTLTITGGACHDVPDWYDFRINYNNWRQKMVSDWNQRIDAHKAPQQKPNAWDVLRDINNIMVGMVPISGAVQRTLQSIKQTGKAPAGQQGGRQFRNDGRGGGQQLPQQDASGNSIQYREWDVNPKAPGVNRGAERLVTGSDGSAYYTSDHYQTFTKIE